MHPVKSGTMFVQAIGAMSVMEVSWSVSAHFPIFAHNSSQKIDVMMVSSGARHCFCMSPCFVVIDWKAASKCVQRASMEMSHQHHNLQNVLTKHHQAASEEASRVWPALHNRAKPSTWPLETIGVKGVFSLAPAKTHSKQRRSFGKNEHRSSGKSSCI